MDIPIMTLLLCNTVYDYITLYSIDCVPFIVLLTCLFDSCYKKIKICVARTMKNIMWGRTCENMYTVQNHECEYSKCHCTQLLKLFVLS